MECGSASAWAQLLVRLPAPSPTAVVPLVGTTVLCSARSRRAQLWSVQWSGRVAVVAGGSPVVSAPPDGTPGGNLSFLALRYSLGGISQTVVVDAASGHAVVQGDAVEIRPLASDAVITLNAATHDPAPTDAAAASVLTTTMSVTPTASMGVTRATYTRQTTGLTHVHSVPWAARTVTLYESTTSTTSTWLGPGGVTTNTGTWSLGLDVPSLALSLSRTYLAAQTLWSVWTVDP